jgi:hypothetical protein
MDVEENRTGPHLPGGSDAERGEEVVEVHDHVDPRLVESQVEIERNLEGGL